MLLLRIEGVRILWLQTKKKKTKIKKAFTRLAARLVSAAWLELEVSKGELHGEISFNQYLSLLAELKLD